MAKQYNFEYIQGSNKPSMTVDAKDDDDAYEKIAAFLGEVPGRSLVSGTIHMSEHRRVDDPPSSASQQAA